MVVLLVTSGALTSGCAVNPYEKTVTALGDTHYSWSRPEYGEIDPFPSGSFAKIDADLAKCASEVFDSYRRLQGIFDKRSTRAPSREERVMGLTVCMEEKGWHPIPIPVEEVSVAS